MTALTAGPKNESAMPNTIDMTTSSHRRSRPVAISPAINPTASARTASETSIANWRETRSTMTPLTTVSRIEGTILAAMTSANPDGRCVSVSASSASATVRIPSPTCETL